MKDDVTAAKYRADYDHMAQRVNDCAWDGAWYVQYFDADGTPVVFECDTHFNYSLPAVPDRPNPYSHAQARQAAADAEAILATAALVFFLRDLE